VYAFRVGGENLIRGLGVRFVELEPPVRERLVELVRTIAYLPDQNTGPGNGTNGTPNASE
jgi:hypothetical protein